MAFKNQPGLKAARANLLLAGALLFLFALQACVPTQSTPTPTPSVPAPVSSPLPTQTRQPAPSATVAGDLPPGNHRTATALALSSPQPGTPPPTGAPASPRATPLPTSSPTPGEPRPTPTLVPIVYPFFQSLYGHPVPDGVLDGNRKTFLVNGFSTSGFPFPEDAWPAVLQRMLDDHTGVTDPSQRIYHVFVHAVGRSPIPMWSIQQGDLACGDESLIQDSLEWYVNPGSKLENNAPPATIVLAQQSLQWAFDCADRWVGIQGPDDLERIEHGYEEIEYFARQFFAGGIQTMYLTTHIYQRHDMAVPLYNEREALELALDRIEALRPGPDMWDAAKPLWPEGYWSDQRHPDKPLATMMGIYWYLVLAGADAKPEIVEKYASTSPLPIPLPNPLAPPNPPAETITNLTTASGTAYQVVIDNDPYGYGLELPARLYVDNLNALLEAPDFLLNETYIQTAQADNASVGDDFFSFEVDQPVTVYVAHDDAIQPKPDWLAAFRDTGVDIVIGERTTMSLYEKEFSPGKVTLGGNYGFGQTRMYLVFIKNSK